MSTIAIVRLSWSTATHDTGIRLYNVYQDDVIIGQTVDLSFQINDVERPKRLKYYIVALTNSGDYLKSNVVEIQTKSGDGYEVLDYTLDFLL